MVKNPPASVGNAGSIPGLGKSPGERNGNTLQYSFFFFYNPVFLPGKSHGQRSLASYIQSMGLQKVGHDLVTKQRQQQPYVLAILLLDIEVKEMKTLS